MFKDKKSALRLVVIFSSMSLLAGLVSAVLSAIFIRSENAFDVQAASSGFITGAVLIAAGLIALSNVVSELKES